MSQCYNVISANGGKSVYVLPVTSSRGGVLSGTPYICTYDSFDDSNPYETGASCDLPFRARLVKTRSKIICECQ